MGKKKSKSQASKDKNLKIECCEKYLKKGEHKRCKRCPSFDLSDAQRMQRFKNLKLEIMPKD